jgi:hypothetical protein
MLGQTVFQAIVVSTGALASSACALFYFRRVRLERPPIGVFNSRDVTILAVFIVLLPVLYLVLPGTLLTAFLVLTFLSALSIALRPVIGSRVRWVLIAVPLVVNIVVTFTMLGTRSGWQVYWVSTSLVVLVAAVGVSNLYVQGGLRMRQIAWFALFLAAYDAFFSLVIPLTPKLADAFQGRPLDPSIGFALGPYTANIGLGDLLVYSMFTVAAYKAVGRKGAVASLLVVGVFGALVPATSPLLLAAFSHGGTATVIPAQAFFGPAAFATYLALRRRAGQREPAAVAGLAIAGASAR